MLNPLVKSARMLTVAALFWAGATMSAAPTVQAKTSLLVAPVFVSSEDEIAIKAVVQGYFDWRATALTEGLAVAHQRQPTTVSLAAATFLQTQRDWLEVAEYGYQLNYVDITRHTTTLDFLNITYSGKDHTSATAEVLEAYEQWYSYAAEPALAQGIQHQFSLRQTGGHWEIVQETLTNAADVPTGVVDKAAQMAQLRLEAEARHKAEQAALEAAGITPSFITDQRAQLAKNGWSDEEIQQQLTELVNAKMAESAFTAPRPNINANRSYNRSAVSSYADAWWNRRNSAWGNYDGRGGDCTNYVSQLIFSGGIPRDNGGSYRWYWYSDSNRSPSWTGVQSLWDYVWGNSTYNGPNGPQGQQWTSSAGFDYMETGDVIQLQSGATWFHTYGVYRTAWVFENWWFRYKVYITSHTTDRINADLDAVASGYTKRYIHILGWYQP